MQGSVFGAYPELHPCRTSTVRVVGEHPCEVLAIHVYDMQNVLAEVPAEVTVEDSAAVAMSVFTAAAGTVR
eukprot:COSAG02_NODE_3886_length_6086_cov_3.247211_6_plen_71_part_00